MDGFSWEDHSLDGFLQNTSDRSKEIVLHPCDKCGAFSTNPGACCVRLLPPAPPLLMPPSPLEHHTQYEEGDEMWGHLLGGG